MRYTARPRERRERETETERPEIYRTKENFYSSM
jgi:hypothetical protein